MLSRIPHHVTKTSSTASTLCCAGQCALLVSLALMQPLATPQADAAYPKNLTLSPDTISYTGARDEIFKKVGMQYQVERIAVLYPDTIVCILFGLGPDRHFRRIQVVFFGPDMEGEFFKNGTLMIDGTHYMFSYDDRENLLGLFVDLHKQYEASHTLIPHQP